MEEIRMRKHSVKVMVATICGALVLAGCGGEAAPAKPTTNESFTVALPGAQAAFALPFLAEQLGYFKDAHLDVTITPGVGANAISMVVTGQADVTMFGTTASFPPVTQGRSTTVIFSQQGGGLGANVAVLASSKYQSLTDLSGLRVSTVGATGAGYGETQVYSKYVVDHGGKPFEIVPAPDATTLVGMLKAGRVAATVSAKGFYAQGLVDGTFRLLVDMADPANRSKFFGGYFAETAIFGVTNNLKTKKEATIRFLVAIDRANTWLRAHKASDIASVLQKHSVYALTPSNVLELDIESTLPFVTTTRGRVTEQMWDLSLKNFATWNTPGVDVLSPDFAFAKRVDMSYLDAAQKRAGH
jgi:NitT/TauT family transport system substrate-binding protein